ncbi:MAG: hypothetical protein ACOYIP_07470 [Coriobacteriales bacterium]|jgi:hypothetical protein
MKRKLIATVMAICTALALSVALAGCAEQLVKEDIVGVWSLESATVDGVVDEATNQELAEKRALGQDYTLILAADDTAALNAFGYNHPGTWSFDNGTATVALFDGSVTCTVANGKLTLDGNGSTMTFTKSSDLAASAPATEGSLANGASQPSQQAPIDATPIAGENDTSAAASSGSIPAGTYTVGQNLDAGEYRLMANGDGYYCIYPDDTKTDIIGNSSFTTVKYVTVADGQVIEVQNATMVPADAYTYSSSITLESNGTCLVGKDCPAGEYELSTDMGMGYYAIYGDSTPEASIIENNNFDSTATCTVEDGQYLEVVRCTATAK